MTSHVWTDQDIQLLFEMNDQLVPIKEQAKRIGTTPESLAQYRTAYGLTFGTEDCVVCHSPIKNKKKYGRKRRYCSVKCGNELNQAYVTHARIEGRDITNCLNCGAKLIPPWSTKKKWCSRACSHRGWYTAAYYGGQKDAMMARTKRSYARREVLEALSDNEYQALLAIRENGRGPRYWMEKLRDLFDIETNAELVRYTRAVRV